MACEIANDSPFSEHDGFQDPWTESIEQNGLDAIVDFNTDFTGGDRGSIDPKNLVKPSTTPLSFDDIFSPHAVDNTFNNGPTSTTEAYPADVSTPSAPYFHQEFNFASNFALQQGRQRSISEPPDGFAQHHQRQMQFQQPQQVTFTREGHWLGEPQARALKSAPRAKQPVRQQPYKTKTSATPHPQQKRYQLRRTQTQPVRPAPAPTSVPRAQPVTPQAMMQPRGMVPQSMAAPYGGLPMQQQPVYVSTRVCTPVPEETPCVDPMLRTIASPHAGTGHVKGVAIPITVDELRAMIVDAVQAAVAGLKAPAGRAGDVLDGGVVEEDDVIVVKSTEQVDSGPGGMADVIF